MSAQLHFSDVGFERGGTTIVRGVELTVGGRDRVGLVGPNGAGKSTLLQLAAGALVAGSGRIARVPDDATVGLLAQELLPEPGRRVIDVVAARTGVAAAQIELDAATMDLSVDAAGAADRYDRALDRWLRLGAADLDVRVAVELERIGLGAAFAQAEADRLSGGEQARVGLAIVLVSQFDILLLDEPTNDLDLAGLDQLESFLVALDRPLVVVSHDRRFLERVVTSVLELDPHTLSATRHGGGWTGYLEAKATARRHAEERYSGYTTERDRLAGRAQTERQWATQGVAGAKKRQPDNDKIGKASKIERTEQLAARARRTERAIERLDVVDKPWEPWQLQFEIGEVERSGDLVAELRGAVIDRRDFRLGPVDLQLAAGDKMLITGPNGAGKTTLLGALLGDIELDGGTQRLGRSVVLGRIDQRRRHVDGYANLLAGFIEATGQTVAEARSILAKFGLGADHVMRPTDQLSPGERTRALLAVFQATGVNALVLDEPTNHLDLPAIEQLEHALSKFTGTLLVVSHDRVFVDAVVCTRHVEVAGGTVTER